MNINSTGIMFLNHSVYQIYICKGEYHGQVHALVFGDKVKETKVVIEWANLICPGATTRISVGF